MLLLPLPFITVPVVLNFPFVTFFLDGLLNPNHDLPLSKRGTLSGEPCPRGMWAPRQPCAPTTHPSSSFACPPPAFPLAPVQTWPRNSTAFRAFIPLGQGGSQPVSRSSQLFPHGSADERPGRKRLWDVTTAQPARLPPEPHLTLAHLALRLHPSSSRRPHTSPVLGHHLVPLPRRPRCLGQPRGCPLTLAPSPRDRRPLRTHLEDILRGDGGGIRLADDALVGAGDGRLLPRLAEPQQRPLHGARPLRRPARRETEWPPVPRPRPATPPKRRRRREAGEAGGGGPPPTGRSRAVPGGAKPRSPQGPPPKLVLAGRPAGGRLCPVPPRCRRGSCGGWRRRRRAFAAGEGYAISAGFWEGLLVFFLSPSIWQRRRPLERTPGTCSTESAMCKNLNIK